MALIAILFSNICAIVFKLKLFVCRVIAYIFRLIGVSNRKKKIMVL